MIFACITHVYYSIINIDKLLFTTNGSNNKYNKIHNWKKI